MKKVRKIKIFVKGMVIGMKTGVDYMDKIIFNNRVPRGICWLITIVTVPINLIVTLIMLAINKKLCITVYDDINSELSEKEDRV